MDISAANFTVIFSAGAPRHETVTKIDQTPQGYKRKQNRLLETHGMGNLSFFFKNTPIPDMRPTSRTGFFQENRFFEKTALESDPRTELAVLDGDRGFISNLSLSHD